MDPKVDGLPREDSGLASRLLSSPGKALGLAGALSLAVAGGWWGALRDSSETEGRLPTVQGADGKERPFAWGGTTHWAKPAKSKWFAWLDSSRWRNKSSNRSNPDSTSVATAITRESSAESSPKLPLRPTGSDQGPSRDSSRTQSQNTAFLSGKNTAPAAPAVKTVSASVPKSSPQFVPAPAGAASRPGSKSMEGSVLLGELASLAPMGNRPEPGRSASEAALSEPIGFEATAAPGSALKGNSTGRSAEPMAGGPLLASSGRGSPAKGGGGGPLGTSRSIGEAAGPAPDRLPGSTPPGPRPPNSTDPGAPPPAADPGAPPPSSGSPIETPPAPPPPAASDDHSSSGASAATAGQIGQQSADLEHSISSLVHDAAGPGIASERESVAQNKKNNGKAYSAAMNLDWKLKQDGRFFSQGVSAGPALRPEVAKRAASAASSVGREMGNYLTDVSKYLDKQLNLKGQIKEFDKGLSGAAYCLEGIAQRLSGGTADGAAESKCFAISRATVGHKARLQMTNEQIRKVVGSNIEGSGNQLAEIDRNNNGKGMRVAGWIETARGKIHGEKSALKDLDKSLKAEMRDGDRKRRRVAAGAQNRISLEVERVTRIAGDVSALNLPATPEERVALNTALSLAASSLRGAGHSWSEVNADPKDGLKLSMSNESTVKSVGHLREALGILRTIQNRAK